MSSSSSSSSSSLSPSSSVLPPSSLSGSSASPSSSKTSATSSATPQPSSASSGINFTVHNMTTCTSGLISWNYSGQDTQLSLSILNIGVDSTASRLKTRQSTVNNTVQQQLVVTHTSADSWNWTSVNVTEGWYEIEGAVLSSSNITNSSAPFYVTNGTNVACLASTSPQASSTASPGSTLSATSHSNVGSIVGGVIGAVIGVALIIIAGIYLWKRKRRLARAGGSSNGTWDSLKSAHSSVQPPGRGPPVASDRFHTHSESTGAILQAEAGGKVSVTTTPGSSDEDVATTAEEKLIPPVTSSGMSPVDALNTPVHFDRRASTYTNQSPTAATNESTLSRSPPRRISNQSLEQQAQRIRSSMETSMRRRGERLSMPTLPPPSIARFPHSPTLSQPREEYPLSPASVTPVNRSISAGAVSMTGRRTSRKPVPQYDPATLLEDTTTDSVSTFTGGADSSSHSYGTSHGTGTYGTPPDLALKESFGDGRPMHYLVPDMPLPQQD